MTKFVQYIVIQRQGKESSSEPTEQPNLKRPLTRAEAPRATHRGCGLLLAVTLIPEAARLFREQFALAALLGLPCRR